jgi:hypothetical protein
LFISSLSIVFLAGRFFGRQEMHLNRNGVKTPTLDIRAWVSLKPRSFEPSAEPGYNFPPMTRRFQFSLKTMMVATAVAAMCLGGWQLA